MIMTGSFGASAAAKTDNRIAKIVDMGVDSFQNVGLFASCAQKHSTAKTAAKAILDLVKGVL